MPAVARNHILEISNPTTVACTIFNCDSCLILKTTLSNNCEILMNIFEYIYHILYIYCFFNSTLL